jgi:hypothetical protein
MAESTVVAVPRDGTITITNGDATSYVVAYEAGDMSFNLDKAERIVVYDRNTIVGLRAGNDPIPSISFSCHLRELADSAEDTILDTGFEQFLVTVEFQANMSALGGSNTKATFEKVLLTASVSEGSPDSISFTGEVYGPITRAEV